MKIIFIMTALCSLFYLTTHAQDGAKSDFQVRMNQHIALKISDPAFMATAKEIYGHTCEKHTNGQLLYQNTLFGYHNYINLDIPSGIYILKSTNEIGEIISTKFSVTK
jgi:hypothetical protein